MRHQYTVRTKCQKLRQHFLDVRCIQYHFIPDAGQFLYFIGNRYLRIDEGRETVHHLATAYLYRADLNDSVIYGGEARRLDIEHDKIIRQSLSSVTCDDFLQIIHQIGFHAIDDLEEILLVGIRIARFLSLRLLRLPQILPDMVGIGEALHHAMVCDRDGPVPPFIGPLYNILRLGDSVHITHLGMTMKLNTLVRSRIHSGCRKVRNLPDAEDGTNRQVMVKFVQIHNALDFNKGARFQTVGQLLHMLIAGKHFHADGIREVRDIHHNDCLLVSNLPGVKLQNLAADDHLANLTDDVLDVHCLLFEVFSVDNIGVVGLFQSAGVISAVRPRLELTLFIL